MKLFSPQQAKIAHNHKQEEDITQIAYLTITLKKLQDRINTENTNWEKKMEEQRTLYTEEKIKLQDEIRDLDKEVKRKEQRLIELLLPIDGLKERAQETLQRAQEQAKSIMEREEEITELKELLAEKIDNLTERELQVAENELKIENRLKGLQEESDMIAKSHANLNTEVKEFITHKEKTEKVLEERENKLAVKELRAKEYLESRTKQLDEQERGLKDRRRALDRGFAELTKLQNK